MMNKLEQVSLEQERLSNLLHLTSYMMGRYNVNQGEVIENKELNAQYPVWIESLLDTAIELADNQNIRIDDIIQTSFSK